MNNHSVSTASSTSISSLRIFSGNRPNHPNISTVRPSGASAGGGNIKGYNMVAAGMFRGERRSLLWMQNVRIKPSGDIGNPKDIPANMHDELAIVSKKFSNVKFEKVVNNHLV